MKAPIALGLLMALLLPGLATAKGDNPQTTGFGVPDCGEWLRKPNPAHKAWLLGFLSGQSFAWGMDKKPGDPLGQMQSAQQAYAWMDNFCRANPLERLDIGAGVLFIELTARDRK